MNKGLRRRPTQMRRRLGPQILKLLRGGLPAEDLVAVRVATKARYDVAGSFGLRNPELCSRPEVQRCVGRFLLSVANAALVEGEGLRVTKRKPEEHPLHGPQLAVHPQADAFESQLKGLLVLGVGKGRAPVDVA